MRIHFDNVNLDARTGPNTFARRLFKQLSLMGHELVDSGSGADVSLVFIQPSGAPLARKRVLRLDGLWFHPQEFYTKNVSIKRAYDFVDTVIWQSHFDKNMVVKWWGERPGCVIHNGTQLKPVTQFSSTAIAELRQRFKLFLVCSANWHPQKRLSSNIELFYHIRNTIESQTCLVVMGNNPSPFIADPDIFYTGSLPEELCLEIFSAADWMLHLAWLDHCPNTVIESISQETPVICSSSGGTQELVNTFGVILNEQSEYQFTLEDYEKPPQIDVCQLTNLPSKKDLILPDVSIESVATRYVQVFESIL